MKRIQSGDEIMEMDSNGYIFRPAIGMPASGQWRILGAVEFNNFGQVVRHYTLAEVLEDQIPTYHYKNGKQKIHLTDDDHGTFRIWMSPKHDVYKGAI